MQITARSQRPAPPHIDTAQAYGNEAGVGEGVRTSGLSRDEIFVTSKLAAEVRSYENAVQAIDGSLKTMGLTLEEAHEAGKLRAIGVSNFEREDIHGLCPRRDCGHPHPGRRRPAHSAAR
jgi:diketogulonate reductase-like aldo/keto reductase